jgi:aspartate kinase
MKVYKFGGASVKDPDGIRNLTSIINREQGNLIIVVSAFGKTTNALETVLNSWYSGNNEYKDQLDNVRSYHLGVCRDLFPEKNSCIINLEKSFSQLTEYLNKEKGESFDYEYDQVVSNGEVWSTLMVAEYLIESGIDAGWIDIRENIITDDRYRDANIFWGDSLDRVRKSFDFSKHRVFVTQGFIGGTSEGLSTTLGREGSDYTAAILANMLDAEYAVVWKDVPGLLNADPKWFPDATKLDEVSYREAVEMTFSGAKIIHPKTIKPLQNKNIPLYVKSFINPDENGTLVTSDPKLTKILPVFIKKENQILLTLLPRDFSFVMGEQLGAVFDRFRKHKIKVNLVEASAVSIDLCVDNERLKIEEMLTLLKNDYSVLYNENVELLTVRHYDQQAVKSITSGRDIILEQKTRSTVRFVVK